MRKFIKSMLIFLCGTDVKRNAEKVAVLSEILKTQPPVEVQKAAADKLIDLIKEL